MCSSGFLQGLIGSPTQCGLPVVVIVPLSLLAPGTHGHPSLSISTPLATTPPWIYSPLAVQHLGIRLESGCRGIVDVHVVCTRWIGKVVWPGGMANGTTTLLARICLAMHSNGCLPHPMPDVSQYACIQRTGASWLSMCACVYASGWARGCPMPRRTGIWAHCGRSLDRQIFYINHVYWIGIQPWGYHQV